MVTENVVIRFSETGVREIDRGIKSISDISRTADRSVDQLDQEFRDFGTTLKAVSAITKDLTAVRLRAQSVAIGAERNLNRNNRALRLAAIRTRTLADAESRTSAETAKLNRLKAISASVNRGATRSIRENNRETRLQAIRSTTAARAQLKLASAQKKVGDRALVASRLVGFLSRAILAFASIQTIRRVFGMAEAFTVLQNRLRVVTDGQRELNEVTTDLLDISQDTRSALSTNANLFSRLTLATRQLGTSQSEILSLTKSLNQAIILSGASAQEANAGLIQLSQGIASGTLRGDELRSVLEQLPVVADVIAKQLGVTRGQLRELGRDGAITADVILKGFKAAEQELNQNFAKTVPTLAQSFTTLTNALTVFIGTLPAMKVAIAELSRIITAFADAIKLLTPDELARLLRPVEDVGNTPAARLERGRRITGIGSTRTAAEQRASEVELNRRLRFAEAAASGAAGRRAAESQAGAGAEIRGRAQDQALIDAQTSSLEALNKQLQLERLGIGLIGVEREQAIAAGQLELSVRRTGSQLLDAEIAQRRDLANAAVAELNTIARRRQVLEAIQGPEMTRNELLAEAIKLQKEGEISGQELNTFMRENLGLLQAQTAVLEERNRAIAIAGPTQEEQLFTQQGINLALEEGNISLDEANLQLNALAVSSVDAGDGLGGLAAAFLAIDVSAAALGNTIGNQLLGAITSASDALADFAISGFRDVESLQEAFSNLFTNLGKQILAAIIQFAILRAIQGGLAGGAAPAAGGGVTDVSGSVVPSGGGNLTFVPGNQAGGFIPAGETRIVGERGPEPFTPTVSGRVEPNSVLGSGTPNVEVQIVNVDDPDKIAAEISGNAAVQAAIVNVVRENSQSLQQVS